MIKIVGAMPVRDRILRLEFSDGSSGDYDLAPLIARDTSLTSMLADDAYFSRFFPELGALSWPNGFELSAFGDPAATEGPWRAQASGARRVATDCAASPRVSIQRFASGQLPFPSVVIEIGASTTIVTGGGRPRGPGSAHG